MVDAQYPNLAILGVPRRTAAPDPDIETLRLLPYPTIKRYLQFCGCCPQIVKAWGGGKWDNQLNEPGRVTSGYRSSRHNSPHEFGLALDIAIGDLATQIYCARRALPLFSRVGLYPDKQIIHVDLFTPAMVITHDKAMAWVELDGEYSYFDHIEKAIAYAEKVTA